MQARSQDAQHQDHKVMQRFSRRSIRRLERTVNYVEDRIFRRPQTARRVLPGAPESLCADRNEQWQFVLRGAPDSGTFDVGLVINGVLEIISGISVNVTANDLLTALAGHTQLLASDLLAYGGPLPYVPIAIEFTGNFAATDMISSAFDIPYIDPQNLVSSTDSSPSGDIQRWVPGFNSQGV